MSQTVKGTFDVTLAPQGLTFAQELPGLGRMSIDKRFQGELDATSKGEMLSAMSAVKGSAGYVAMERVSGTLQGKKGSFVLQHSATMNRGAQAMSITVVPDSGTEELTGLTGNLIIDIVEKKHYYTFTFEING
jgi:predicted flavoprotein YhiN